MQKGINAVTFSKRLKGDIETLALPLALEDARDLSATLQRPARAERSSSRVLAEVKGLCHSNPTERLPMKKGGEEFGLEAFGPRVVSGEFTARIQESIGVRAAREFGGWNLMLLQVSRTSSPRNGSLDSRGQTWRT